MTNTDVILPPSKEGTTVEKMRSGRNRFMRRAAFDFEASGVSMPMVPCECRIDEEH
jgi:hypothetical protein